MQYIKCSVNILLHNSGCCRGSVAPWVVLPSPHNVRARTYTHTDTHTLVVNCFTILFLCGNRRNMALRTDPHYMWHFCKWRSFAGPSLNKRGSGYRFCVLLANAGYGSCPASTHIHVNLSRHSLVSLIYIPWLHVKLSRRSATKG